MIRIPEDGILYHGSYTAIEMIDLGKCHEGLDFGRGFYLTSSFEQAVSFISASVRKAQRRGVVSRDYNVNDGAVSTFCFSMNEDLRVHCFDEADAEWLHFVACNRNRSLFTELYEKYVDYDIIGGKIADDQTAITLNNYVSGIFGKPGTRQADDTAIALLEPERLKDQFCFRTVSAVSSLQYVRSDNYGSII